MSRDDTLDIVRRAGHGLALGLSWLPSPVLRALTWDRGVEHEDEMLETVARALECDLVFVDAGQPWAASAARRLHDSGIVVAWAVAGVLGRLASERGLADVLRATVAEPGTLAYALDRALHGVLHDVREGGTAHAEMVVVADDLAGASGWLVSPDYAMEGLLPSYERAASVALEGGALPVFHSDGDVRALYPALARAGFAGIHVGGAGRDGIEAAMPAAARAGLVLLGGIQVSALAHEGARHMGNRLASLARAGGLVICDDGGVSSPEEVAVIATVLEAARHAWDTESEG